jgi:ORF6N domain
MAKAKPVEKAKGTDIVSVEQITRSILVFRGHKVLLDSDLAELYGVATKVLLQAVRRNQDRFPEDFMIQLTAAEWAALRSRIVTLETGRGQHRKYLPYAFTEQGVAMLSSVLNSPRAITVNIEIMRAFVKLRELLSSNRELARRFEQLEARVEKLIAHDQALGVILSAIRALMAPPSPPPKKRPIGFTADLEK